MMTEVNLDSNLDGQVKDVKEFDVQDISDGQQKKEDEELKEDEKMVTITTFENEVLQVDPGAILKLTVGFRLRREQKLKDLFSRDETSVRNMKITIPINMNGAADNKDQPMTEMVHDRDIGEIAVGDEKLIKINIPMKVQRTGKDTEPVLPLCVTVPVRIEKNTFPIIKGPGKKKRMNKGKKAYYYCCHW